MDMTLSVRKEKKTKKTLVERMEDYIYATGTLCAPGVIANNSGYVPPIHK